MLTRSFFARAPLAPGRFAALPVGAISARGAMRDRLIALRGGCSPAVLLCSPNPVSKASGSAAHWAAACTRPMFLKPCC